MTEIIQADKYRRERYIQLVNKRKMCRLCAGLTNPSEVSGGRYDRDHIGPWSCWQGNLNSPVMVIGQDWGNPEVFEAAKGLEPFCSENDRNTNGILVDLLNSIGIKIERPKGYETTGKLFFTNPILCLKPGKAQDAVKKEWFKTCGVEFIKPLIEILRPIVVISLGKQAYYGLELSFSLKKEVFVNVVNNCEGIKLDNTRLFPMYHCGRKSINMNRNLEKQLADWARVGAFLKTHGICIE